MLTRSGRYPEELSMTIPLECQSWSSITGNRKTSMAAPQVYCQLHNLIIAADGLRNSQIYPAEG
jgi:hypothetical protein